MYEILRNLINIMHYAAYPPLLLTTHPIGGYRRRKEEEGEQGRMRQEEWRMSEVEQGG